MKIVGIFGVPGTGKTTLMRSVMEHLGPGVEFKAGLVAGHYFPKHELYVLGRYGLGTGVFAGTDKLSMGVQPHAVKFLGTLKPHAKVLFEGDRLFNASFLVNCKLKGQCGFYMLQASQDHLRLRYNERGSAQSESFLRGRYTKCSNLFERFRADIKQRLHAIPEDTDTLKAEILGDLGIILS